jgi:hypothetical protein
MDQVLFDKIMTHLKHCQWYALLSEDIKRVLQMADRIEYETVPNCTLVSITRVIRVYIGVNLWTVRVRGNGGRYSIETNQTKYTHTSL